MTSSMPTPSTQTTSSKAPRASSTRPSCSPPAARPLHEFRKAALPGLRQHGQLVAVEPLQELVPLDPLQRVLAAVAGVVDPQHAGIAAAARPLHARRGAAAPFHPSPDLVVIGDRLR